MMLPSLGLNPVGRVSVNVHMGLAPVDTREEGWGEWCSIRAASDSGQRRIMENSSYFAYYFLISGCFLLILKR
jgi:hypothetical protein